MIFYLGDIVKDKVKESKRTSLNKLKRWKYGYNKELDTVIISKDGTLGEIYNIMGLNIGLPEKPKKNKDILNYGKRLEKQKFVREELPEGLTEETMNHSKYQEYIAEEFRRREEGLWCFIKGEAVYISGTYYFGVQWCRENVKYSDFRIIQNELMIFWEACKADERCYGMDYVKNRRFGASFLAIIEQLDAGTINEDKILGIVSKKGNDSKKIFRRLIKVFRRLPCFFRPIWDGTNNPKTELVLEEPTKRKKAGEKITEGDGLGSIISWHNTEINAMDGENIFRSLLDECLGEGTKVLMADFTFKEIENIKVGDKVIVEGGKIVEVAKTTKGVTDLFKVSQPYNKDYIVTRNHRLYLEQRCKVKGYVDGVKIMTPQEYIDLGKYKKRTTFGVRSKGIELPKQEVKIDPYLLGLWLGDGEKDNPSFAVNTKDVETIKFIKEYTSKNKLGLTIKKTHTPNCFSYRILRPLKDAHKNGKHVKNPLTELLKEYNLYKNKHIPNEYLKNNIENRLLLLAGILDSDGYLSHANNSYHYQLALANKKLFDDSVKLIRSLGFKVSAKKRISNLKTEYYSAAIHGDLSKIPCRVARKIVPKTYKRKYADHINKIDIQPIGKGKFYGITLKADNDNDRRIILEDFTLTLNSGKYPKEVPFSEYWYIVKTSHRLGSNIVGKSMVVSTVNAMKKGGAEFKKIWDDSDANKRNDNGQTKSGLYRIFIPAKYGLEGFYDEYGFSIVSDPYKPTLNDLGKYVTIGSETFLKNEEKALKDDPEKLNEHKRQFPETEADAFRDESGDCEFNLIKLQEQLDYNKWELEDDFEDNMKIFRGNNDLVRGNFQWENGVRDSIVVWRPDPENGRFFIKKDCFPPAQFRNKYEQKYFRGQLSKAPIATHVGAGGVDPYNRSRTVDGRGSFGSYILTTKTHTCADLPNNAMIVEYIDRPRKVELFFEDMIMVSVFYSMPFLSELSNERFLHYVKDRGYRHYSINNPFKLPKDLSHTEKEIGGAPQQDSKIGDAQFYATESYIEDYVGVAQDNSNRPKGEMGDFPFSRTLYQLKDVDTNNRTKYDAYIAFSLSRLANQRIQPKKVDNNKKIRNFFQTYDNSGVVSKYM